MSDETIPQWGYSKNDAKIFDLKEGESLPNGYYVHPSKVPGSEAMKKAEEDAEGAEVKADADAPKVTGL